MFKNLSGLAHGILVELSLDVRVVCPILEVWQTPTRAITSVITGSIEPKKNFGN